MKRNSFSKGAFMLLLTLASCTSNLEQVASLEDFGEIKKVTVTLPEINVSTESRIAIQVGSGVDYIWESTDSLGIFPNQGYQVAFPLNASSNSNSATFEGGGWGLLANSEYAAYYPFKYNNQKSNSIPITYVGQKQVGNKNTSYADSYNYMVSRGSKPVGGTLNFTMQFLGRLIILKFNVPEPTTLSSVKLIAPENVFTTKGYFNLWEETPSIVSTETSNSLTIELENITTTSTNEEVTVYFFMAPVNLSGKTLTIEATDINGHKILSTVAGKDMTDSKAYVLTDSPMTEVEVTEAGTLQDKLGNDYINITSLKINGKLNGTDIALIRKMSENYSHRKLINLDIEDVEIVAGGTPYYSNYTTTDNIIGEYMFMSCQLQSIILPKNITSIKKQAFTNCIALSSISIPSTVTSIGESAFDNCALSEITIPDNVKSIEARAFNSCNNLKHIKLGNGINSIEEQTFGDCSHLEKIELPCNITKIGNSAFSACMRLSNIKIRGLVTSIGNSAFSYCSSLKTIDLPSTITTIGIQAFKNCTSLKEIILPLNLTAIKSSAFYGCTSLTSINLPSNLSFDETRDNYIFAGCTALSNVNISPGIKVIPQDMFRGCTSLKQITIPSSVTTIGGLAFYQSGLEKVYVHCTTPPNMTSSFYEIPTSCKLYVPKGYSNNYTNSSNWETSFSEIIEMKE